MRSKISASSGTRLVPARDWLGRARGLEKVHCGGGGFGGVGSGVGSGAGAAWRARPFDASLTLTAVTAKRVPVRYAALGGDCCSSPSGRSKEEKSGNGNGNGNGSGAGNGSGSGSGGGGGNSRPEPVTNGADSPRVLTYDDWLSAPPNADTVEEVPVDPLGAAGVPGRGSNSGGAAASFEPPSLGARAWLTPDCPVPASTVFSLLDLAGGAAPPLAAAGRLARRLCADGLLPVKLSVPLLWTLRVKLSVFDFVLLDDESKKSGNGDEQKKVNSSSSTSSSSPPPAEVNEPAALAASLARDPRAFFDLPPRCRRKTVQGLREARAAKARAAAAAALAARRGASAAAARGSSNGNNGNSSNLNRQASRASDGFPMSPLRDGYDEFEF